MKDVKEMLQKFVHLFIKPYVNVKTMQINYPQRDHKFFICQCESPDHVLHFVHDKDYDELYTYVFLHKHPFFKRLWYGIKYIFGYQSRYGAFDEFMFNKTSTDVMVKYFKKIRGE